MWNREQLDHARATLRTQKRRTDGHRPFLEDALGVFLQPELASHPDYHDGWGELRPRQISISANHGDRAQARRIVVTAVDHARLQEALSRPARRGLEPTIAKQLERRLAEAQVVCAFCVSPGVVTMNSSVLCEDTRSGELIQLQLVYPNEETLTSRDMSVLHPMGEALLGLKVGEHADWPEQGRLAVREIHYQPEAHLYH